MTATSAPVRAAAARTAATRVRTTSIGSCDAEMRKTSAPAAMRASSMSGVSLAGPTVATMRVRRNGVAAPPSTDALIRSGRGTFQR